MSEGSSSISKQMELQEVMDFLQFAYKNNNAFNGALCFHFVEENGVEVAVFTVRVCPGEIHVIEGTLSEPTERLVQVYVSIEDFLYLYSGEASPSEVASMCISGRVRLPWSQAGSLKSFADSFDFSSEKWDDYYAAKGIKPKPPTVSLDREWNVLATPSVTCSVDGWEWLEGEQVIADEEKQKKNSSPSQQDDKRTLGSSLLDLNSALCSRIASIKEATWVKELVSLVSESAEEFQQSCGPKSR